MLWWPEPFTHTVDVIDAAITMYGRIYPLVPPKHKLQMAEHFADCVKGTKNVVRQQAVSFSNVHYKKFRFLQSFHKYIILDTEEHFWLSSCIVQSRFGAKRPPFGRRSTAESQHKFDYSITLTCESSHKVVLSAILRYLHRLSMDITHRLHINTHKLLGLDSK